MFLYLSYANPYFLCEAKCDYNVKTEIESTDLKRVLYWFHLAFKEKSPSKEDGESLKMILSFAQCDIDLVQDVDENDDWGKRY